MAGEMKGAFGDADALTDRERLHRVRAGLVVTRRVIWALIMREARTRYGRSDLGYAWAIIDPLIEFSLLMVLFTAFGRVSPIAVSLPAFLISGLMPFHLFRDCMSRGSTAASANAALLTYPQVKVMDVVAARVLLETATFLVVYVSFVFVIVFAVGDQFSAFVDEPRKMIPAFLGLFYFGFCCAVFSSSMNRLTPIWGSIWGYLSRPLWFLSGVFFTLSHLPNNARRYMTYNPVAHVLEWWRSGTLSAFESTAYSPLFVLGTATVLLFIGLAVDRMLTMVGHSDVSSG